MTRRGRGRPPHPDILTPAEWRVLEELRTGGTFAEIAVRLGVSPDAVRFHVRNMRAKLNLRDRAELVAWKPSDGERRRFFRALLAPLAALPFATRTIAGAAAAVVVAGAVVATIVLVVALGSREGTPPAVVVPEESAMTPGPTDTLTATSSPTPEATPVATPETTPPAVANATPTTAPPRATPAATPPSETPPAVASSDCTFEFRDVFDFWVPGPDYDPEAPEVSSNPPGPSWIGHGPPWGLAILELNLIAVGDVQGVERLESPSNVEVYLVLAVEVEEVLWGAVPPGTVLRLLVGGPGDEVLDWDRVEVARESLLCSKVLFWDTTSEVPISLAGVDPGERLTLSGLGIALGPPDDPFIDELAQAFRVAARDVQPRTCSLFSQGTGQSVAAVRRALFWPPASVDTLEVDSALLAPAGAVKATILDVAGESVPDETPSQGALVERFLLVNVEVEESLGGFLSPGDRLRLALPVAATFSPQQIASLLPCSDVLLILEEFAAEWLQISLPDDGAPLYGLKDWGLYLETNAGGLLNPYVTWSYYDWVGYGPAEYYGVSVQGADFGEFSAALRAALANP